MNVHVVVSVYKGIPFEAKAYLDEGMAERARQYTEEELEIQSGLEAESANAVHVFSNVPVF